MFLIRHVQTNNIIALKFYIKFGFVIKKVEFGYYSAISPTDAFYLEKLNPFFSHYETLYNSVPFNNLKTISDSFLIFQQQNPFFFMKHDLYKSIILDLNQQLIQSQYFF